MTILVEADDDDLAWLLAGTPPARNGRSLPPGGVDEPAVIAHVRAIAARLRAQDESGTWMILSDDEVVGLCGYHRPPSADGVVEIGYNVAASRRRRGHASAAVKAILVRARADRRIVAVVAETDEHNVASQRVLEGNGFERVPIHDESSTILWRRDCRS